VQASLYLVDDDVARGWQPFALTRPAGELRFGAFTQRERAERLTGLRCTGHLAAPHLAGFEEPDAAPVVAPDAVRGPAVLLLVSRVVLDWDVSAALREALERPTSRALLVDGQPVGLLLAGEDVDAPAAAAADPATWPDLAGGQPLDLPGRVLTHVWQLMSGTPDQTARDAEAVAGPGVDEPPPVTHRLGDAALIVEPGVVVEPNVVFDLDEGPVWLRSGSTVRPFSRVVGPTVIDPGSTLLGGPYEAVSIGPVCKVHGEMEETVVLGYSNKAHDGFLGHAYVGRWVNLGAMTTNSDLKNNYGSVRVNLGAGEVDTGEMKIGSFLGDHVKTGIGMLLNTGTVLGAGCNVYGSEMPPKYLPPFTWGGSGRWTAYDADRFIATARTVMGRRDVELSDGMERVLREAWRASESARREAYGS